MRSVSNERWSSISVKIDKNNNWEVWWSVLAVVLHLVHRTCGSITKASLALSLCLQYSKHVSGAFMTIVTLRRSALHCAMIRVVGESGFSTQETAHMFLSLPLVSCICSFATLSLIGDLRIVEDTESGQLIVQQSLFDHYHGHCYD